MTMPTLAQVLALAVLFAFLWLAVTLWRRYESGLVAGLDVPRARVNELFRKTVVAAEDPRFSFDGATAEVLEDQEAPGEGDGHEYALTRYARNPEREYFMFMFEVVQGEPRMVFMKVMEHNVARFVLKEKYLPPPLL